MNSLIQKVEVFQLDRLKYKGFVLVTVMMLLTILSVSGFLAFELSQFSYKTNQARLAQMRARHISEEGRLLANDKLISILLNDLKVFEGSDGLSISIGDFEKISQLNSTELVRFEKQGLVPFFEIKKSDLSATVYIQTYPTEIMRSGAALSQNMSYQGDGIGLGQQGSFGKSFELRSKGTAKYKGNDVIFWSASDYRFIP